MSLKPNSLGRRLKPRIDSGKMNRNRAIFQLGELISHADDVIEEIREGRYDEDGDICYQVAINHLMDHLMLAWHYAVMSDEDIDQMTQEQFEKLSTAIPQFEVNHQLVQPYDKIV